jgi:hypothetical protein
MFIDAILQDIRIKLKKIVLTDVDENVSHRKDDISKRRLFYEWDWNKLVHRVDRVLGFFSSRPTLGPPTP